MNEDTNQGLQLLKKGQKGLIHMIFSRLGLIVLLLAFHIFLMFGAFRWFGKFLPHLFGGTLLFTAAMVLYLLNSRMDNSAKLTWLIVILLLPVFGALLFCYTRSDLGHRALKKRMNELINGTRDSIPQDHGVMEQLEAQAPEAAALARYLSRTGCYPAYGITHVRNPQLADRFADLVKTIWPGSHVAISESGGLCSYYAESGAILVAFD